MKNIVKVTRAGARVMFAFVFSIIGLVFDVISAITSGFDGVDEYGSSDNYEMGKVYNYNSGKFDNGYTPDGWYDDWN